MDFDTDKIQRSTLKYFGHVVVGTVLKYWLLQAFKRSENEGLRMPERKNLVLDLTSEFKL